VELIPLSALNHYVYCPRRAALIHVEGIFEENEHTILGELVHEHADLPGYEVANGVLLWRSLPVWSERLGLSGKCDIVEVHPRPASGHPLPSDGRGSEGEGGTLLPVEYKKGKRRRFDNDDAQLCAQALCLEEMFGIAVPRGAVFHAESKRRREVAFTAELRSLVERSLGELRRLLDAQRVPRAVFKPACEECSLFEVCLPKAIEDT
jgi:CRISPR-associated exonuclease Cas4